MTDSRALDRTRVGMARLSARLRRKIDFWSLDQPKEPTISSEWQQPGLSRYELREAIETVVPTNTLVGNFVNMLFRYSGAGDSSIDVETSSENLRRLTKRAFLERQYTDPPIALFQVYDLEDLLRGIARELMVHGRTALIAMWGEPRRWKTGRGLPQFRIAEPSRLKEARLPSGVAGFEFAVSETWPERKKIIAEVEARDVVELHWPLPPGRNSRALDLSPVDRVVDLFKEKSRLENELLAIFESHAYPDRHSFRAERARWQNPSHKMARIKTLNTAIEGELYGLITDRPLTKYYDAYRALRHFERLAIVREYIIGELNRLIERFSELAGYKRPARLIPVGYPSSGDCKQALNRFADRQLSVEEAIEKLMG